MRPGFNIDGRDRFRTGFGASCSLLLFLVVLVYAVTSFWVLRLEKTGAALVADDHELGAARGMHVRQDEHDFFFAVAVSSKTNFKGQSAAKFIE